MGEHLIGRKAELALATDAVARVEDGVGAAVVVAGEAGIGKSTLAREVGHRSGLRVLRGACSPLEAELPLSLWVRLLRLRPSSDDPVRRELASLVHDPEVPVVRQLRALEGIAELVEREAIDGPILLLIDDLQWIDGRSLAALARVADLATSLPVAVVATMRPWPRPDGLDAWERPLDRLGRLVRLRLGPLETPDVQRLATDIMGGDLLEGVAEQVSAAAGNPLFVREVVLASRLAADGRGRTGSSKVSDLAGAVARHLEFLPADVWSLLRTVAALGPEAEVADVAIGVGLTSAEVVAGLRPALESDVLQGGDAGSLAFAHDLVRTAVVESEPLVERSIRVAALVDALAEAGRPASVWAPLLPEADRGHLADPVARLAIAGRALLASDVPAAAALLREAMEHGAGTPALRWQLAQAEFLLQPYASGRVDAGPLTEQVEAVLAEHESVLPNRLLDRFLVSLPLLDDPLQGALLRRAMDVGLSEVLAPALDLPWTRHDEILQGRLQPEDGPRIDRTLATLLATGDPLAGALAVTWQVARQELHTLEGRRQVAAACRATLAADEADPGVLDLPARLQVQEWLVRIGGMYEVPATEGVDVLAAQRVSDLTSLGLAVEARVAELERLGALFGDPITNHAELAQAAPDAVSWLEQGGPVAHVWPGIWTAWVDGAAEHPDLVEALSGWTHFAAFAAVDRDDLAAAADHLERRLARVLAVVEVWPVRSQEYALAARVGRPDLVRGDRFIPRDLEEDPAAARMAAGDPDAVLAVLAAGFPAIGHLGLDLREDVAELLAEHGRDDDAIEVLRQSLADWTTIGATRCAARVTARLRSLGVSPFASSVRRQATSGWDAITMAEWRVLHLLEQDLIYREIAERLFLSRRTVESHVSQVFRKLEVTGRRTLALLLREGEGADRLDAFRTSPA